MPSIERLQKQIEELEAERDYWRARCIGDNREKSLAILDEITRKAVSPQPDFSFASHVSTPRLESMLQIQFGEPDCEENLYMMTNFDKWKKPIYQFLIECDGLRNETYIREEAYARNGVLIPEMNALMMFNPSNRKAIWDTFHRLADPIFDRIHTEEEMYDAFDKWLRIRKHDKTE